MRIRFTRSATKHRISRNDSKLVVQRSSRWITIDPPPSSGHLQPRRVYVGPDENGRLIEVFAIELEDGALLVIHAMSLRQKTQELWERTIGR